MRKNLEKIFSINKVVHYLYLPLVQIGRCCLLVFAIEISSPIHISLNWAHFVSLIELVSKSLGCLISSDD
jgi:hypothetical protein